MKKLPRKIITKMLDNYQLVQVACTFSNACRWQYLTTSGQVCREEYGFEEDCDVDSIELPERYELPPMTWSSVKRLQRALQNLSINS